MAKERKASVIYEGNASQLVYAFPFDYLRKKFVKVEDIYTNITELTIGADYTVEDKQVRLVKGIPLGHSVKIYRETTTAPLVEWQDASVLRSADLSLQEVQLLHLAEETGDRVFDSGMSTAYDNPNCWDGQYKRIINVLDPIEDGDVVTIRYIKANQDSLLNQLKNTGETQNARLIATGDTQNARLVTTGNSYVSTMTTLRDATTTKATEANNSADLAKKWAVSETSPDGAESSKSARTWAGAAKISASAAASSANASQTSATNSASSASVSTQKATDAANSATSAASSASQAASSATAAKASETNAASSASAAAQSAENAKTWDPTQYVKSVTEANGKLTVTKGGGDSTIINLIEIFCPVGTVYMSAHNTKTIADFPFMAYGTWEEVPVNLCLQTGVPSEAGKQRRAGLPNITGEISMDRVGGSDLTSVYATGALFSPNEATRLPGVLGGLYDNKHSPRAIKFNASLSNSIYGASSTVQPPAYLIRAWVRTA